MYLIKVLTYFLFIILCILIIFVVLLIIDFFFDKNIIDDTKLKKAQVTIIALTLSATIIKFFIEIQEKYALVSDRFVLLVVLFCSLFSLCLLFFKDKFKDKSKTKKGKKKNIRQKTN